MIEYHSPSMYWNPDFEGTDHPSWGNTEKFMNSLASAIWPVGDRQLKCHRVEDPYRTPEGRDAILAAYSESFDLLLGRRTYDLWSGFWPKAPSSPLSDAIKRRDEIHRDPPAGKPGMGPFERLGPDIVEDVRRVKSYDGPVLILSGSSTLTSTLLEHGLADELVLIVYPVLLGKGKRLFSEGTPPRSFEPARAKALS